MLHVTCHVSYVTCHMSHVTCHFGGGGKLVKLIGGGSVINGTYNVSPFPSLHVSACLCLSLSFPIRPCLSLFVPVCPCLSLSVSVFPCLSLHVPTCPCLSLSVLVCPCLSLHLLYLHFSPCRWISNSTQLPTAGTHEEVPGLAPLRKLPAVNFEAIFRA